MKWILIIIIFNITNACSQQKVWNAQPNIKINSNKKIEYKDPNTEKKNEIFPVMLYSFNNNEESKNENFWSEINNWGVNVVFSWDTENQAKFIGYANKYNVIALSNNNDKNASTSFASLPDEPIGAGTATFSELKQLKSKQKRNSVTYLNHDVAPYYYRKKNDKTKDPFDSKINCKWCKQGRGTELSYTEANTYADIIAFDFYPYNNEGIISRNINDFGETSVGEFTQLLKKKYSTKPIWPVIQTLWFNPWDQPFKGNIIDHKIIRNLTFDAIVNGADGISFFGHGQTTSHAEKKELSFLKGHDEKIWKETLYQCYELKELQVNYDKILIENNVYESSNIKNGFSFSVKKVKNKEVYYIFVVNHLKEKKEFDIKIPTQILSNSFNSIEKVGMYKYPSLKNISKATTIDFRKTFSVTKNVNNIFTVAMESYGVAIFKITK